MMNAQERARAALSIRSLTPTQVEDCLPSIAAALEAVERETVENCAAFPRPTLDSPVNPKSESEGEVGIGEKAQADTSSPLAEVVRLQENPCGHCGGTGTRSGYGDHLIGCVWCACTGVQKQEDPAWLEAKAAAEDGCFVSAGGLVTDLEKLEQGECACRKALQVIVNRVTALIWTKGWPVNGPEIKIPLADAQEALSSPCPQARVAELEADLIAACNQLRSDLAHSQRVANDATGAVKQLKTERDSLRSQLVEMEAERLTLRRRIHLAEGHNQFFERCESAWCNPTPNANPAAGQIGAAWETPAQFQARINELEAEMERRDRDGADSLASFHHALASRDSFLSQLLEARAQLAKSMEHRGNFLWPYDKETEPIKRHGYEVINGRNDEYIQIHWDALIEAVEAPLRSQLLKARDEQEQLRSQLAEERARMDWIFNQLPTILSASDYPNEWRAEIDAARSKDSTDGK